MLHTINEIDVDLHIYSPDIPVSSADCTIYTTGIGTQSFTVSSSWDNSTFVRPAEAIANHYNVAFSFHQVLITAALAEAV